MRGGVDVWRVAQRGETRGSAAAAPCEGYRPRPGRRQLSSEMPAAAVVRRGARGRTNMVAQSVAGGGNEKVTMVALELAAVPLNCGAFVICLSVCPSRCICACLPLCACGTGAGFGRVGVGSHAHGDAARRRRARARRCRRWGAGRARERLVGAGQRLPQQRPAMTTALRRRLRLGAAAAG